MEDVLFPPSQKKAMQIARKSPVKINDIWLVVRKGSVADVDSALLLLKKSGGNVNARNSSGLTPLHIAVWRNNVPILRRLLEAGADPNARDGESGWSSLHRALYFGHLAVACTLLQYGASLTLQDSKMRVPVDLLSGPVIQAIGKEKNSIATEVLSWGSGVNYQLGTGNAHLQKLPCKVDSLQGSFIKKISSAKFHSVAVSERGEVYTWGFGRGGRLGHPDFDIHSGQAAVITPRQVTSGLGARRVKVVAAAKHHTVVATEGGEVFTWGSNREGQLGYTSVDTQATPRRVSSLKARIVAVAAANKHSAVVSEAGEVYTWGCNKEGQLGYGTSNSASNYTPRVVEYLKGKSLIGVSAAKYHTIVLGSDGEVFTWGHRLVSPRRVIISRNLKKAGSMLLKFHRHERLNVIAIAAGMTNSMALAEDGTLFYWDSPDPDLRCHQLYLLCGKSIVSVSAGKYWTAVVTTYGDIYMWDGKKGREDPPIMTRLHGVKKATSVSVGETHLLIISSLYHPVYVPGVAESCQKPVMEEKWDGLDEFDDMEQEHTSVRNDIIVNTEVQSTSHLSEKQTAPTLKSLCEKVAAQHLVEPRNAIQLMEIADSLGAEDLRNHCEEIVIRNLDFILAVSSPAFCGTSLDVLVNLEKSLDSKSSEPWSHRQLPTPTATFPVIINSEEEDADCVFPRTRGDGGKRPIVESVERSDGFLKSDTAGMDSVDKQIRALRKKLQQIELLEERQSKGFLLDSQQITKLQKRSELESSLSELGALVDTSEPKSSPAVEERCSRRGVSRKQRQRSKKKHVQEDHESHDCPAIGPNMSTEKSFLDSAVAQHDDKEEVAAVETQEPSIPLTFSKKSQAEQIQCKPTTTKKKGRKGGLSMFLSGALDNNVPMVATAPTPIVIKTESGPAWGGAKTCHPSTSLRIIQDEQSKSQEKIIPARKKEVDGISEVKASPKLVMNSVRPSSPIPTTSIRKTPASDGDKCTPPWASASASPPCPFRPSLRDIQLQQGKQLQQQQKGVSHSPKTKTTGFSVMNGLGGSPSETSGVSRWFKPETDGPSSIRSIQIEEKAIKDLKRFYSSVRIVKNQS